MPGVYSHNFIQFKDVYWPLLDTLERERKKWPIFLPAENSEVIGETDTQKYWIKRDCDMC